MHANAKQRANLLDEITQLQPRYGEIFVPTEIVHGTADDTVGLGWHSERLIEQIPGAELIALPGIGHMPQVVAAPEVAAAIDRATERAGLR
jgi:pimeloyl-ACP methyl ester carboxylesterase